MPQSFHGLVSLAGTIALQPPHVFSNSLRPGPQILLRLLQGCLQLEYLISCEPSPAVRLQIQASGRRQLDCGIRLRVLDDATQVDIRQVIESLGLTPDAQREFCPAAVQSALANMLVVGSQFRRRCHGCG